MNHRDDHERTEGQEAPEGELAERLAALDEQLKQGWRPPERDGATALNDEMPDRSFLECLMMLEQRWPRTHPEEVQEGVASSTGLNAAADGVGNATSQFGKFVIEAELGRGTFGVVYLAQDTQHDRQVALKIPRPEWMANSMVRERFLHEARAGGSLTHPNIVKVFEAGQIGSRVYIASEACPGLSLDRWLLSNELSLRQTCVLIIVLAEALQCVHDRGVLHRDLKPANILLWPREVETNLAAEETLPFNPKLTDFGLAKLIDESLAMTHSSQVIGTPLYMAPEQAECNQAALGPATDVYALGAVFYHLLTGTPPFTGTSLLAVLDQVRRDPVIPASRRRPLIPKSLDAVLEKALEKKARHRYASAQQLADDVRRFLKGQPTQAAPLSWLDRVLRWCRRRERVDECGRAVMLINVLVLGIMALTQLMVSLEYIPNPHPDLGRGSWWGPRTANALIALLIHVPLIGVGYQVTRAKRWAVWVSLLMGLAFLWGSTAMVFNLIPNGSAFWDDIPGFRVAYTTFTMLALWQTVSAICAWLALREMRR